MEILDALKKALNLQKELSDLLENSDVLSVEPWGIQVREETFVRMFGAPRNPRKSKSGIVHYEAPFFGTKVTACFIPEEGVSLEEIDP